MLGELLIAWMAVLLLELGLVLGGRIRTAGLVLGWMVALSVSHLFGAFAHWVPWSQLALSDRTETGFLISTIGLYGLFLGARLAGPRLARWDWFSPGSPTPPEIRRWLPLEYALFGLFLVGIVSPILGPQPTLTAITSIGPYLLMIGASLAIWRYWTSGSAVKLVAAVGWIFVIPIVTLAMTENVIRAVLLVMLVCCFACSFYRPRWALALAGATILYGGLSLGLTYLAERTELREELREADLLGRFSQVARITDSFQLFDPWDQDHLDLIELRMNQNSLVGAAQENIETGGAEFAKGETLVMAAQALVPRIIWPDKPVGAGSMGLAGRFTGLEFAESTSVGLGPILEWYVNFGLAGALLGMFVCGALIGALDHGARAKLEAGNWTGFALMLVAAFGLVQAEGSFVGVTATIAAGLGVAWFVNRCARHLHRPARFELLSAALRR